MMHHDEILTDAHVPAPLPCLSGEDKDCCEDYDAWFLTQDTNGEPGDLPNGKQRSASWRSDTQTRLSTSPRKSLRKCTIALRRTNQSS